MDFDRRFDQVYAFRISEIRSKFGELQEVNLPDEIQLVLIPTPGRITASPDATLTHPHYRLQYHQKRCPVKGWINFLLMTAGNAKALYLCTVCSEL